MVSAVVIGYKLSAHISKFCLFLPCTSLSQAQACIVSMYPVIQQQPLIPSTTFHSFLQSKTLSSSS